MLNVKKKKSLRIVWWLSGWLFFWLVHNGVCVWNDLEIRNYGVSFGFNSWWVWWCNFGLLLCLTYIWWNKNYLGLSVILVGGWVNMLDRLVFGYVRDYWKFITVYNNIADWLIALGVGILIWKIWKKK